MCINKSNNDPIKFFAVVVVDYSRAHCGGNAVSAFQLQVNPLQFPFICIWHLIQICVKRAIATIGVGSFMQSRAEQSRGAPVSHHHPFFLYRKIFINVIKSDCFHCFEFSTSLHRPNILPDHAIHTQSYV